MENNKLDGIIVKIYIRMEQQLNFLFQNAMRHGLNPLIYVPDDEVGSQLIEFIKKRSEHVYYGKGSLDHPDLPGIYVTSEAVPGMINRFKSIGIAKTSSETTLNRMIEEAVACGIPMMITENDSESLDYWSSIIPERNIPDYPRTFRHLENKDIRDQFINTFLIAEKEIDIICPWINQTVVNEKLISLMSDALGRGVKIKIVYGIGDSGDVRSQTSDKTVDMLRKRFDHYLERLSIKRHNSHVKLLLCDDKYMMMGSYNFLSFAGDYDDNDLRGEAVNYEVDSRKISQLRLHHFS